MSTRIISLAVAAAVGLSLGAWAGEDKHSDEHGLDDSDADPGVKTIKKFKFDPNNRTPYSACEEGCGLKLDSCSERCGPIEETPPGARNRKRTAEERKKAAEALKKPATNQQKCLDECGKQQVSCLKACK